MRYGLQTFRKQVNHISYQPRSSKPQQYELINLINQTNKKIASLSIILQYDGMKGLNIPYLLTSTFFSFLLKENTNKIVVYYGMSTLDDNN